MEENKVPDMLPFYQNIDKFGWKDIEVGDIFATQSIDYVFKVEVAEKPLGIEDYTNFRIKIRFLEIIGVTDQRKKFLKEAKELVWKKDITEVDTFSLYKLI